MPGKRAYRKERKPRGSEGSIGPSRIIMSDAAAKTGRSFRITRRSSVYREEGHKTFLREGNRSKRSVPRRIGNPVAEGSLGKREKKQRRKSS